MKTLTFEVGDDYRIMRAPYGTTVLPNTRFAGVTIIIKNVARVGPVFDRVYIYLDRDDRLRDGDELWEVMVGRRGWVSVPEKFLGTTVATFWEEKNVEVPVRRAL